MQSGQTIANATRAESAAPRAAQRGWPLGLLGMLVLILVVEWGLTRQRDLTHPWAVDWSQAVRAIPRRASQGRILCFGDSLMKYGVVAPVLASHLQRPAYNFALGAGPPPASLAMLRQSLAAGARPDAILVDFIPHLLSEPPAFSELLLPEVLRPLDAVQLAWDARDPSLAARLVLARLLPSVRNRLEVRTALMATLAGDARHLRAWHLEAGRRNWRQNLGSHVALRAARAPGDDLAWANHLYPSHWQVDPTNALAVKRFLRLATSAKIPVFWVIPPLSPEVHARRALTAGNLDAQYDEFVAGMHARFPEVTVLDGRHSGYDASVHADPLHLDRRGAAVFTEDIAAAVRQRLDHPTGPGPIVSLPPFRDRPADHDLEDHQQSLLATHQRYSTTVR